MADTQTPEQDSLEEDEQHEHPGVKEYVEVGIILAVLTAAEVGLYFAGVPRPVAVPSLIFLTAMKFVLVVLWFMHLRFDSVWFRRLFWTGVVGAGILYFFAIILITVL